MMVNCKQTENDISRPQQHRRLQRVGWGAVLRGKGHSFELQVTSGTAVVTITKSTSLKSNSAVSYANGVKSS